MLASLHRIPRAARLLAVVAVAVATPCSVLAGPGAAAASARLGAPPAGTISTIAGNVGGPGPARHVAIAPCGRESRYRLCGLTFAGGHLYTTDVGVDTDGGLNVGCVVRSISMSGGQLSTPAGSGLASYSGDGGPGSAAGTWCPADVAVGAAGNVVIADNGQQGNDGLGEWRVRMVAAATGTFYGIRMTAGDIYTVAGDGTFGPSPSNGQSAIHSDVEPGQVAIDHSGNLIIGMGYPATIWVVAARHGTFYGQAMTAGDIYEIAGAGSGYRNGRPALKAGLGDFYPGAIQVDRHGNLVVAVTGLNEIRVIATTTGRFYRQNMTAGDIYTVASGDGGGPGQFGDGGPATKATMRGPEGEAIDAHGNLVIADTGDNRIRVVAVTTGRFYGRNMTAGDIYTVAGGGTGPADGGAAGKTFLDHPRAVAVDSAGNIAVADAFARRLLLVAGGAGTFYGVRTRAGHVYVIAGNGQEWLSGSGGPATAAQLLPNSEAIGRGGNLLVADADNDANRSEIRLVAVTTGTFFGQHMIAGNIYTIAGIGGDGYSGDGGPAVLARLAMSTQESGGEGGAIAASRTGNLVIFDSGNNRVRVVADRSGRFYGIAMKAGDIYTVAGNGSALGSGDGGLATKAALSFSFDDCLGIAVDASGNIAISDDYHSVIRMVAAVSGTFYGVPMKAGHIYRIAGDPKKAGFAGDGGPALAAEFYDPLGLAVDQAGNLLIDDSENISFPGPAGRGRDRIRVVAATTGTFYGRHMTAGDVYTVAGNGKGLYSGDGGPAIDAGLDTASVSVDPHGNLLLTGEPSSNLLYPQGPSRVRIIAAVSGTFYGVPMTAGDIYTVAGTSRPGDAGDGGLATAAELSPVDAVASTAGIYIADAADARIRFVRS